MSGGKKKRGRGHLVPQHQLPPALQGQVAPVRLQDSSQGKQSGQANQGKSITQVRAASFTGPLPHPDILRGFGEVIPGLDKTIVGWVEEETTHRREMERREMSAYEKALTGERRLQGTGMFLHFVLIAGMFGLAFAAIRAHMEGAAIAAILTAVGTAVAAFFGGRKQG